MLIEEYVQVTPMIPFAVRPCVRQHFLYSYMTPFPLQHQFCKYANTVLIVCHIPYTIHKLTYTSAACIYVEQLTDIWYSSAYYDQQTHNIYLAKICRVEWWNCWRKEDENKSIKIGFFYRRIHGGACMWGKKKYHVIFHETHIRHPNEIMIGIIAVIKIERKCMYLGL